MLANCDDPAVQKRLDDLMSLTIFSPGLLVIFLIIHYSVVTMRQKHSLIKLHYLDP